MPRPPIRVRGLEVRPSFNEVRSRVTRRTAPTPQRKRLVYMVVKNNVDRFKSPHISEGTSAVTIAIDGRRRRKEDLFVWVPDITFIFAISAEYCVWIVGFAMDVHIV